MPVPGVVAPPEVLIVTPTFPPAPGGIERLSFHLATGFQRLRVRVLALDHPDSAAFDAGQSFALRRVHNQPAGGRRAITHLAVMTVREAIRSRPDAILSMHIRASLVPPLLRGIPTIQYTHAKEMTDQPRLARYALRSAASVIAVSAYTASLATRCGAAPDRLHVIPPGTDPLSIVEVARARAPTLITVSRLEDRYKGHDVVLAAMPRIRAAIPDVRWSIVGDGSLRLELEARTRALGLGDAVTFHGALSDEDRDRALLRSHVFVMPSRVESADAAGDGFGIVFLEASAHGLAVIAGWEGGALDAVRHERTGLLIDPNSPDAVADAAIALLGDLPRAMAYGRAGIEHAGAFTWPSIVERVENVILQTLDRAQR
jgi:phosphatidylinositol alpha-1,6-mannosyltransferase